MLGNQRDGRLHRREKGQVRGLRLDGQIESGLAIAAASGPWSSIRNLIGEMQAAFAIGRRQSGSRAAFGEREPKAGCGI